MRTRHDYGIDLRMRTYNAAGEIESGDLLMQVKATDALKTLRRHQAIPLRLEWRDLLFWINEPLPVMLVIYDAQADKAWWLYVQQYMHRHRLRRESRLSATVTFYVPTPNELHEAAIGQFAAFQKDVVAKIAKVTLHEN